MVQVSDGCVFDDNSAAVLFSFFRNSEVVIQDATFIGNTGMHLLESHFCDYNQMRNIIGSNNVLIDSAFVYTHGTINASYVLYNGSYSSVNGGRIPLIPTTGAAFNCRHSNVALHDTTLMYAYAF